MKFLFSYVATWNISWSSSWNCPDCWIGGTGDYFWRSCLGRTKNSPADAFCETKSSSFGGGVKRFGDRRNVAIVGFGNFSKIQKFSFSSKFRIDFGFLKLAIGVGVPIMVAYVYGG